MTKKNANNSIASSTSHREFAPRAGRREGLRKAPEIGRLEQEPDKNVSTGRKRGIEKGKRVLGAVEAKKGNLFGRDEKTTAGGELEGGVALEASAADGDRVDTVTVSSGAVECEAEGGERGDEKGGTSDNKEGLDACYVFQEERALNSELLCKASVEASAVGIQRCDVANVSSKTLDSEARVLERSSEKGCRSKKKKGRVGKECELKKGVALEVCMAGGDKGNIAKFSNGAVERGQNCGERSDGKVVSGDQPFSDQDTLEFISDKNTPRSSVNRRSYAEVTTGALQRIRCRKGSPVITRSAGMSEPSLGIVEDGTVNDWYIVGRKGRVTSSTLPANQNDSDDLDSLMSDCPKVDSESDDLTLGEMVKRKSYSEVVTPPEEQFSKKNPSKGSWGEKVTNRCKSSLKRKTKKHCEIESPNTSLNSDKNQPKIARYNDTFNSEANHQLSYFAGKSKGQNFTDTDAHIQATMLESLEKLKPSSEGFLEGLSTSLGTNLFRDNDASVQASMMESLGTKKTANIKDSDTNSGKVKSLDEEVITSRERVVRDDQVKALKFASSSRKKTEFSMKSMLVKLKNNKNKREYKTRYCIACILVSEIITNPTNLNLDKFQAILNSKCKTSHHFTDHWKSHGFKFDKTDNKWSFDQDSNRGMVKNWDRLIQNSAYLVDLDSNRSITFLRDLKIYSETEYTTLVSNLAQGRTEKEKLDILGRIFKENLPALQHLRAGSERVESDFSIVVDSPKRVYKDRYCIACLLSMRGLANFSVSEMCQHILETKEDGHHFNRHWKRHGFEFENGIWSFSNFADPSLNNLWINIQQNYFHLNSFKGVRDDHFVNHLKEFSFSVFEENITNFITCENEEQQLKGLRGIFKSDTGITFLKNFLSIEPGEFNTIKPDTFGYGIGNWSPTLRVSDFAGLNHHIKSPMAGTINDSDECQLENAISIKKPDALKKNRDVTQTAESQGSETQVEAAQLEARTLPICEVLSNFDGESIDSNTNDLLAKNRESETIKLPHKIKEVESNITNINSYFVKKLKSVTGTSCSNQISLENCIKLTYAMLEYANRSQSQSTNISRREIMKELRNDRVFKVSGGKVRKYNYTKGSAKFNAVNSGFYAGRTAACKLIEEFKSDLSQGLGCRTVNHNIASLSKLVIMLASSIKDRGSIPNEDSTMTEARKFLSAKQLENGVWILFLISNPLFWINALESFLDEVGYRGSTQTKFWIPMKKIISFFKLNNRNFKDIRKSSQWYNWSEVEQDCNMALDRIEKALSKSYSKNSKESANKKLVHMMMDKDIHSKTWKDMMQIVKTLFDGNDENIGVLEIIQKGESVSKQDCLNFQYYLMAYLIYRTGQRSEWVTNLTVAEWDYSENIKLDETGDRVIYLTNHKNVHRGQMAFAFIESDIVKFFQYFRDNLRIKLKDDSKICEEGSSEIGCKYCSVSIELPLFDDNYRRTSLQMQTVNTHSFFVTSVCSTMVHNPLGRVLTKYGLDNIGSTMSRKIHETNLKACLNEGRASQQLSDFYSKSLNHQPRTAMSNYVSEKEKLIEMKNAVFKFRQIFDENLCDFVSGEKNEENTIGCLSSPSAQMIENVDRSEQNDSDRDSLVEVGFSKNNKHFVIKESPSEGTCSLVTNEEMRAQVQEAIEHDLEDIGTFYKAVFQKPFINKRLTEQPVELQEMFRSYRLSSKAKDLEKFYEEQFGMNYFKENKCFANLNDTLTIKEVNDLKNRNGKISSTNSFRGRLFNICKDRFACEQNNIIAAEIFDSNFRRMTDSSKALTLVDNKIKQFEDNFATCPKKSHVRMKVIQLIKSKPTISDAKKPASNQITKNLITSVSSQSNLFLKWIQSSKSSEGYVIDNIRSQSWDQIEIKFINHNKGFGVVASIGINANETVCDYHGKFLTKNQYEELDQRESNQQNSEGINRYVMLLKTGQRNAGSSKSRKIEDRLYAIDAESGCECHKNKAIKGRYINHAPVRSKDKTKETANLKTSGVWVRYEDTEVEIPTFVTTRCINEGEELLFEYNRDIRF